MFIILYTGLDVPANLRDTDWLAVSALLSSKHWIIDDLNLQILERIPVATAACLSVDTMVYTSQKTLYPPEFLNSLSISGLPPHILSLKLGAHIILLRNLDPTNGHCNGIRYWIKSLAADFIEAVIIKG